jgi:hypothetical protein
MTAATEKRFEAIAEKCSAEAAKVRCSVSEYIDGVQQITDYLVGNIRAAKDNLKVGSDG